MKGSVLLLRCVRIWYVAIVTARTSFAAPVYSPIWSSPSRVFSRSSRRHWVTAVWFVVRISVLRPTRAITPMPTTVLPAPHGRTITPLPPSALPSRQKARTASCW